MADWNIPFKMGDVVKVVDAQWGNEVVGYGKIIRVREEMEMTYEPSINYYYDVMFSDGYPGVGYDSDEVVELTELERLIYC